MFLSPIFLIAALAGAGVPLLLHLMQSSRTSRTPFPTVRFLKLAQKRSSRRIKMENILLWLIRTLIMLLLGLAFAMPMLRTRRLGWLGEAPRDVALVIDGSYSMGYITGRETVWKKTTELARELVEGLGEKDRVCVYLAREQADPVVPELARDREEAARLVEAIELGYTSSKLAPTLVAANDALKKETRRREREIFILTDRQAIPWASFGGEDEGSSGDPAKEREDTLTAWDPASVDKWTTVFVALMGVSGPENASPVDADMVPPLLLKGSRATVTTRLTHSGESRSSSVALVVDDEEIARRSVVLGAPDAEALSFGIPALPPGVHTARLETPEDNLPADDAFHFLIRVKEELPVLCVGTRDDTFFLRAALGAGMGGSKAMEPRWLDAGRLPQEKLEEYACVFLCNALPVPGQALGALERYIRDGGLVAIFPGSGAAASDYRAWQSLPGIPLAATGVPVAQRKRLLTWDKPGHAVLRTLRGAEAAPVVTIRQMLRWETLAEDSENLVSSGAGEGFLLERVYGRGRVLMFAVAADRSWSDFPLSPLYLPMVLETVEYGAGVGSFSPYLWTSDSLSLERYLPEATRHTSLRDPGDQPVPIRSAIVEGRTVLHAEDLYVPGVYTMSEVGGPKGVPALALNVRRAESDLAPLDEKQIRAAIGIDSLQIANGREALLKAVEEHRIGRTYGEHLLWIVLVLAVIEFLYANRLLKSGPTLTDQLSVQASGRVRGGLAAGLGGGAGSE